MGLNEPRGGLGDPMRRLVNNNVSAAKVSLSVAPGEEMIVADNVAGQLEREGFTEVTEPGAIRDGIEAALASERATAEAAEAQRNPKPAAKTAVKPKKAAKKAATKSADDE